MAKLKAESFDHAIVFAFAIFFTVVGLMAVASWMFASLNWTGPLGLVKGGVQ